MSLLIIHHHQFHPNLMVLLVQQGLHYPQGSAFYTFALHCPLRLFSL
jgi:hypothetical protein